MLNQLIAHQKQLDEKINLLEQENGKLKQKLESIESKPPVNVERIDYHFDQLKIERLEGTLNIGLNPSDIAGTEEFSINSKDILPQSQSVDRKYPKLADRLQTRLLTYLDEDIKAVVENTKKQLGVQAEDSYTLFIQQDIRNQLNSRIHYYLQNAERNQQPLPEEELEDSIYQSIKNDMHQAIYAFFSQFPMKGDEQV